MSTPNPPFGPGGQKRAYHSVVLTPKHCVDKVKGLFGLVGPIGLNYPNLEVAPQTVQTLKKLLDESKESTKPEFWSKLKSSLSDLKNDQKLRGDVKSGIISLETTILPIVNVQITKERISALVTRAPAGLQGELKALLDTPDNTPPEKFFEAVDKFITTRKSEIPFSLKFGINQLKSFIDEARSTKKEDVKEDILPPPAGPPPAPRAEVSAQIKEAALALEVSLSEFARKEKLVADISRKMGIPDFKAKLSAGIIASMNIHNGKETQENLNALNSLKTSLATIGLKELVDRIEVLQDLKQKAAEAPRAAIPPFLKRADKVLTPQEKCVAEVITFLRGRFPDISIPPENVKNLKKLLNLPEKDRPADFWTKLTDLLSELKKDSSVSLDVKAAIVPLEQSILPIVNIQKTKERISEFVTILKQKPEHGELKKELEVLYRNADTMAPEIFYKSVDELIPKLKSALPGLSSSLGINHLKGFIDDARGIKREVKEDVFRPLPSELAPAPRAEVSVQTKEAAKRLEDKLKDFRFNKEYEQNVANISEKIPGFRKMLEACHVATWNISTGNATLENHQALETLKTSLKAHFPSSTTVTLIQALQDTLISKPVVFINPAELQQAREQHLRDLAARQQKPPQPHQPAPARPGHRGSPS